MIYHVLNGDGLAGGFDLEGEKVVCRECLIEGETKSDNLPDFWQTRADFIKTAHGAEDYFEKVKTEFDKLESLESNYEVNLWFGNEAFCQVNLWFILSLIAEKNTKVFRVFPDSDGWSCSFGNLEKCLENRTKLVAEDLQLGKKLWEAFCSGNFVELKLLSKNKSDKFLRLEEVGQALIEKKIKPKEILGEIQSNGEADFNKIFTQFKEKAGIYGYGDSQVKNLLAEV
jgi:Domain of unknown function (DUF1835)